MNETLTTRQLRLVALLVGVVVLAGGYWMVVRKHTTTSPRTASSTPVSTTPTSSTPSKTHHTASPPARKLATHGMPVAVARALQKHSVVVVSLFSPRSDLDKLSSAEARAGAAASNAGFVSINVFHQRAGIPLLHKLGVVDTPAVLVVTRRHAVTSELKGFVDRNVVAQAVTDAR
jgi:thiol:disulfide interchange protein